MGKIYAWIFHSFTTAKIAFAIAKQEKRDPTATLKYGNRYFRDRLSKDVVCSSHTVGSVMIRMLRGQDLDSVSSAHGPSPSKNLENKFMSDRVGKLSLVTQGRG